MIITSCPDSLDISSVSCQVLLNSNIVLDRFHDPAYSRVQEVSWITLTKIVKKEWVFPF